MVIKDPSARLLGTIHILRQQKDWIGGFVGSKKESVFSDLQYQIYADIVGGWVRMSPKIC